ncbi:hypothetical protein ACFPH8_03045 [Bizionia hallyeonensis]|uniref:Uncharacterized protein n=1 Tax=Bizionia hallyeonensis TaxID=1123757 RepID=A0ABW0C239_9FLAO
MFKNLLKVIIIAPFLVATTCEDDLEADKLVYNVYKANVSTDYSYSINDTIWISGKISSNLFNASINDSIFMEIPQSDHFSIYKFIEPTNVSNCQDAIDSFELVRTNGQLTFSNYCENGTIIAFPELENNREFYSYRIGLKPKFNGDYVISWRNGMLQNSNRNEFIIENYPIENFPNQIGFNSCGDVSWRYLNESDKEYYFKVE